MKIVVLGTLEPLGARLSSTSAGMLTLLSLSKNVDKIDFHAQKGGLLPPAVSKDKVTLCEPWEIDNPVSLIRAMIRMARKKSTDVFFFNLSLTMFGRSRLANVVGLLVPTMVSILARKKVVVYMHDFIETEEPNKLGYDVGFISKLSASVLERLLVWRTSLVAPRKSQRLILEKKYNRPIRNLIIPYVEGINDILREGTGKESTREPSREVRVLLFGNWGPQKDLSGALKLLLDDPSLKTPIRVTIAGNFNPNFPKYKERFINLLRKYDGKDITYIPYVADAEIPSLFNSNDILFLPYFASGGYSAVMNLGAIYDLKIVAYDVDNLREISTLLEANTVFLSPGTAKAPVILRTTIESIFNNPRSSPGDMDRKLSKAANAMEELITFMSPNPNSSPTLKNRLLERGHPMHLNNILEDSSDLPNSPSTTENNHKAEISTIQRK